MRRWLARHAVRRGRTLHLVLLDVTPEAARAGQRARGRGVSGYAFARHRRAVGRLLRDAERGRLPPGCASAVLLDRPAAGALRSIAFPLPPGAGPRRYLRRCVCRCRDADARRRLLFLPQDTVE